MLACDPYFNIPLSCIEGYYVFKDGSYLNDYFVK